MLCKPLVTSQPNNDVSCQGAIIWPLSADDANDIAVETGVVHVIVVATDVVKSLLYFVLLTLMLLLL